MDEGRELWEKYCGFFDKTFSEQVAISEKRKEDHFEKWKNTKVAAHLSPEEFTSFEDVPLTTYEDYPVMDEFGKEVERLEKKVPLREREELWDYYRRIGKQAVSILDGSLVDEYAFSIKTSGSGGHSKWVVYDKTALENGLQTAAQMLIISCSDEWGTTKMRQGDAILNSSAPSPYGAAVGAKLFEHLLTLRPPTLIMERTTNMRKKMSIVYETIEKGEKIDILCGPASVLSLIAQYFTEPDKLYVDMYRSMNPGIAKIFLFLKYIKAKVNGRKYEKASQILPIKGLISTAWDGTIYLDYLRDQYNIEPFNVYASTDALVPLMGRPHRKFDLFPNLDFVYLEFLADDGTIVRVDDVETDHLYELVVTPFGGLHMRYRMSDIFRVIDLEEDGPPVFRFESRKVGMLDVLGYFNITEAMIRDVMFETKLCSSDNWAVAQEIHPKEKVYILIENEQNIPEGRATELAFDALRRVNPFFENYVRDFKIRQPSEILLVQHLRKGAFMRYTMKRSKEGGVLGQIKPPKVIGPEKIEIADLLRSI
jgi:hypothetical protein